MDAHSRARTRRYRGEVGDLVVGRIVEVRVLAGSKHWMFLPLPFCEWNLSLKPVS